MALQNRIEKLVALGDYIRKDSEELEAVKVQAKLNNPWFTIENINFALKSIANQMLDRDTLQEWIGQYSLGENAKKVGLILAGNIPLVGFHDLLCCYISGHHALVKASSKDSSLTVHLLEQLNAPDAFTMVDRLKNMDAVIATGSNHSAKQFEAYFKDYPHIIRRNRSGVSVLSQDTTREDIALLGKDVFTYFGLGCRNVSKIYISPALDKTELMEVLHDRYNYLINHSKYKNNYDYNHAIFLLNGEDFLASGAVLLRRNELIVSRIACLHYEEYEDLSMLEQELMERSNEIQCISGNIKLEKVKVIPLGECQHPAIDDYADGVDTLAFLSELSKK